MIRWLVGTFRRVFGGSQAQVYRVNTETPDLTAPTIMYGLTGR